MSEKDLETFCPTSRAAWRQWLETNHLSKRSVWLICYKKQTNLPTVNWSEAVDEALCFGWIDSTKKTIDEKSFMQLFCPRKPNSTWSKINKDKIERLIEGGQMAPAGLEMVEMARQNGSWTILDEVEALVIPVDLEKAMKKHRGSKDYFLSLSKSVRKMILYRVVRSKRVETRQKHIALIVESMAQRQVPKL